MYLLFLKSTELGPHRCYLFENTRLRLVHVEAKSPKYEILTHLEISRAYDRLIFAHNSILAWSQSDKVLFPKPTLPALYVLFHAAITKRFRLFVSFYYFFQAVKNTSTRTMREPLRSSEDLLYILSVQNFSTRRKRYGINVFTAQLLEIWFERELCTTDETDFPHTTLYKFHSNCASQTRLLQEYI